MPHLHQPPQSSQLNPLSYVYQKRIISYSSSTSQPFYLFLFYSGYFYSASASPLLLSGAPDTVGLRILRRSFSRCATGNCEWRTCLRSLRGGQSGIRTHHSSEEPPRIIIISFISTLTSATFVPNVNIICHFKFYCLADCWQLVALP